MFFVARNLSRILIVTNPTFIQSSHGVDVISIGSMGIGSTMNLCPIPCLYLIFAEKQWRIMGLPSGLSSAHDFMGWVGFLEVYR
jgi:hypothetical protein